MFQKTATPIPNVLQNVRQYVQLKLSSFVYAFYILQGISIGLHFLICFLNFERNCISFVSEGVISTGHRFR